MLLAEFLHWALLRWKGKSQVRLIERNRSDCLRKIERVGPGAENVVIWTFGAISSDSVAEFCAQGLSPRRFSDWPLRLVIEAVDPVSREIAILSSLYREEIQF